MLWDGKEDVIHYPDVNIPILQISVQNAII